MGIHILGDSLHHQAWTAENVALVAIIIFLGVLAFLVKAD